MNIEQVKSADGRRLMKAKFVPHDPNPSKMPEYEVVFEVKQSGKVHLLSLVSATRDDTRENVFLTEEQRDAILEAVASHLADKDDSPMWEDS